MIFCGILLASQAVVLFDEWVRVSEAALTNDKAVIIFLSQMQHSGMLKTEESAERFFRVLSVRFWELSWPQWP